MQIHSVTEHINNLNSEIDKHIEFIHNVKRMRELQNLITKDEPHLKLGNGIIQLQAVEKLVDDFIIERIKNNG